jgi:hypothetical protein
MVGAALAISLAMVAGTACDDPVAGLTGVTAVSTADGSPAHTHRCTIPRSDIDDPPMGGRTYPTTSAEGHQHMVHLSEGNLRDLQQPNAAVSVTSSMAGSPAHDHRFDFVR